MSKFISIFAVAALASSAFAAGQFQITEIYTGISGEDGTSDWFELSNLGTNTVTTAGLFYDDSSADAAQGGALETITLAPGQSVVIVLGGASEIDTFESVWGTGLPVIPSNGGGSLNAGGDSIFILLADNTVITSLVLVDPDRITNQNRATVDTVSGEMVASQLGVNGAFESLPFLNDTLGTAPDFTITLIGSPGTIPAPGGVAILGLGGIAAIRRRR